MIIYIIVIIPPTKLAQTIRRVVFLHDVVLINCALYGIRQLSVISMNKCKSIHSLLVHVCRPLINYLGEPVSIKLPQGLVWLATMHYN